MGAGRDHVPDGGRRRPPPATRTPRGCASTWLPPPTGSTAGVNARTVYLPRRQNDDKTPVNQTTTRDQGLDGRIMAARTPTATQPTAAAVAEVMRVGAAVKRRRPADAPGMEEVLVALTTLRRV